MSACGDHRELARPKALDISLSRIFGFGKTLSNRFHAGQKESLVQCALVIQELVWMLHLDPIGRNGRDRKIGRVEGDNDVSPPDDRRGENVAILGIWECQSID
jgi:hypothetical protein